MGWAGLGDGDGGAAGAWTGAGTTVGIRRVIGDCKGDGVSRSGNPVAAAVGDGRTKLGLAVP